MIGFAQPTWLLGLLLAPLIWYLHRSGPVLRRVPVPSLEPWRETAASAATAGQRKRADAAWWRRAAIAVLLSLALAGPQWSEPAPPVTVWIDDSLSMLTAEAGVTRLEQGIALAQAALRESSVRDVVVRRLSEPAQALGTFAAVPTATQGTGTDAREPRLPPPQALDPSRAHWLLTDGADAAVNAWAAAAPIARRLQTGRAADNVGITRVSARRQLGEDDALAVQVRVLNGGSEHATRTLQLLAGGRELDARTIELEAGAAGAFDFAIAAAGTSITAQLLPGDALAEDDALSVDPSALGRLAVRLDTRCGEAVRRAVQTHPALQVADGGDVQLAIDCGAAPGPTDIPRIVLASGATTNLDPATLLWSGSAGFLQQRLAGQLPTRVSGSLLAPAERDVVLLASGAMPLLILRDGLPRVVESALDVEAPGFAQGPGLPLLLAGLADFALDSDLLGQTVSADRGDDASRVMPLDVAPLRPATAPAPDATPIDLRLLLLLALALLAWDLRALARRLVRDRAFVPEARA